MRRRNALPLLSIAAALGLAFTVSPARTQDTPEDKEYSRPGIPMLVADPKAGAWQPSVAVDAKGGVHVAFVSETAIRIASCHAGETSFRRANPIAYAGNVPYGMRRGPRLVAFHSTFVATWIGPRVDATTKEAKSVLDLYASISQNWGQTWSEPRRVNGTPGACGEGLHSLAAGPGKTMYAVWLQPVHVGKPGMGIRLARSDDEGATWPLETSVYDPPSGSICECCHPTVAVASSGKVAVMFRNSLNGARDMHCVESSDSGKTWGKAWKLGTGTWELPACPMDGGGAAYLADGTLFAAWRRKDQVYVSRGTGEERHLGEGAQPWVGGAPGEVAWSVWTTPAGRLLAEPSAGLRGHEIASKEVKLTYPVVAGSASGTVFSAWESTPEDGAPVAIHGMFLARPAAPK